MYLAIMEGLPYIGYYILAVIVVVIPMPWYFLQRRDDIPQELKSAMGMELRVNAIVGVISGLVFMEYFVASVVHKSVGFFVSASIWSDQAVSMIQHTASIMYAVAAVFGAYLYNRSFLDSLARKK